MSTSFKLTDELKNALRACGPEVDAQRRAHDKASRRARTSPLEARASRL